MQNIPEINAKTRISIDIFIKSMLLDAKNNDFTKVKIKAQKLAKALEKLGA